MALMLTSCGSLCERITVVEKLLNYLEEVGTEIESGKRNRDSVVTSEDPFQGRKKRKVALEAEEVNSERRNSVNDENLVTAIEHVESLGLAHPRACMTLGEIESREQSLRRGHESLAARETKVDEIVRALDERIKAVEEREKEIELKEERFRLKLEDEKARKQQKLKDIGEIVERLESAENKLAAMREYLDMRLEEVECRENVVCESLVVCVKEGDLIMESIEKKMEELEKMRREFNSFQEEKMRELESKEKLLNEINEKAVKDAKLRTEELIREGDLIKESINKELNKVVKVKSEFNLFQERKMGELYSKEKLLNATSEKIANDAKVRNEKFISYERSIYQLLERLNLAKDDVEGLKDVVDQRFKSLASKEKVLNSTTDWVDRRMDKADSRAKRLEIKKMSIELMDDNVICKKYELREKQKKLDSREQALQCWQEELRVKQKEVDSAQVLNQQQLEKLDAREKSMRELTRKCFKENLAKKKELRLEKDFVYKVASFLGLEEENLKDAVWELELGKTRMSDHVRKDLDESADLKFVLRMDGINLQMFLNDPGKNLVSMGDEIFKVLHLSSNPAKLVLDAMTGFYPPHLRIGDTALDVRRTCIALLKQLIKMSRQVKPCVREEAMQVALAWKSKMGDPIENSSSLEVLGFLLLVAAYDLASSFDKDETSTLLMMVLRHGEETPELDCLFCFAEMNLAEKALNYPSITCLSARPE